MFVDSISYNENRLEDLLVGKIFYHVPIPQGPILA